MRKSFVWEAPSFNIARVARTRTLAAGLAIAIGLASRSGRTEESAPVSVVHDYSPYERGAIDEALTEMGRKIEDDPEGKTIEAIDVRRLEVFEKRDPVPSFLNVFHATTRHHVIEREVLLKVGGPYQRVMVDETARNLRALFQLSLVLCVPLKGSSPGKVRLLVITKDVWSLRLNMDFSVVAGRLEYLLLQPTEVNLFGVHHRVGGQFILQPNSYQLGLLYEIPWMFGERIEMKTSAGLIFHRPDNVLEGSAGGITVRSPLYSTRTEWGWVAGASWQEEYVRRYSNGRLSTFRGTHHYEDFGDPYNLGRWRIPFEYHRGVELASVAAVRSFGWASKNDFTIGMEASRKAYRTPDLSTYAPSAVDEFTRRVLPISDTRVGPYIEHRAHTSNFMRMLDVEILGLQEDIRLGYDIATKIYPVIRPLGSSRNFLGMRLAAQYTQRLDDGYVLGNVNTTLEADRDAIADGKVDTSLRIVTPRTLIGRLVFDAQLIHRFRNYLNTLSYTGGEGRLRGYPSSYVFGKDMVAYSVEYRSRPVEILSVQLGGVLFYDTADAFDGFSEVRLKHSVGGGLRLFFPQFNKIAFRGDIGFPIEPHGLPSGVSSFNVVIAAEQAFSVPTIVAPTTESGR